MKIIFQFEGGFLDGKVVAGDTDALEPGDRMQRYLFLSHWGRVGARFRDHPNHFESDDRAFEFIETLLDLGVDSEWLGEWEGLFLEDGQSIEEMKAELVSYLSAQRIEIPSGSLSVDEYFEASQKNLRNILGEAYVYEVVAREIIDDEIRVRVALVGEDQ